MLEKLAYADGETALTGWLARPSGTARGAMVVFPTIANVNDHMRKRAAMLAEAGFVALIADFYGAQVESFEQAGALASKLREDVDLYRRRLVAALRALEQAAPGLPLGAIGYCMGGQAALEVARSGENLAFVASFHGLLETARKADKPILARMLVCHGDADPLVPRDHVLGLWQEMDAVGARWHFHAYSGVRHGFTDPASDARGLPAIGYDASADHQSWVALMALCDEVFG
jgi:dienelactone hydrolase